MLTIVDLPTVVKEALDVLGNAFVSQHSVSVCQHFAKFLTGLPVAERKHINRNLDGGRGKARGPAQG